MKLKMITYWAATVIVAFVLLSGGAADLARPQATVEGMVHLGYPLYFMTIIGIWKLLGAVALLAPGFPRLKEWAYAGVVIELTGAVASHAVCGDEVSHLLWPGFFAVCTLVSWVLRPQSRTLGVLFPGRTV